jgi:hypothetical protein
MHHPSTKKNSAFDELKHMAIKGSNKKMVKPPDVVRKILRGNSPLTKQNVCLKESYCRRVSKLWTAIFQISKPFAVLVNMPYEHVLDIVGYDPKTFLLETDASYPQSSRCPPRVGLSSMRKSCCAEFRNSADAPIYSGCVKNCCSLHQNPIRNHPL